jgi:hypothetical protein
LHMLFPLSRSLVSPHPTLNFTFQPYLCPFLVHLAMVDIVSLVGNLLGSRALM